MSYIVRTTIAGMIAPLGPAKFATLQEANGFIRELGDILGPAQSSDVMFEVLDSGGRLILFRGKQKAATDLER